ncbi:GNAT family N-acetyltransferase [Candidatus Micrarchaeota archaeon]|nr:GNAT family N-acetyltransferase [Candidatus Micrarchaeota archaeon]
MDAQKPGFIEITVDMARPEELPKIIGIYRQHGADCNEVGCNNTFVARNLSGVAVGAVTVKKIQPGWVSLKSVGVEPELVDKGIGGQMVAEVVEKLKREGNHSITVDLNLTQNQQDFYEKMGFKPLDSKSMMYKPD